MTLDPQALEAAARCSYQYEGDRKKIAYVGWDNEPEDVRDEWRVSVAVAVDTYQGAVWQDIDRMPFGENFLAENRFGDWLTVRRFDPKKPGDYSSNAVINGRTGRWWYPLRWQPLPPPPVGSGQNLADANHNPPASP